MLAPSSLTVPSPSNLADRLPQIKEACLADWRGTTPHLRLLGPRTTRWRRWSNGRATRRLIDDLSSRMAAYPVEPTARHTWREAVRARLQDFGETRFEWPARYRRLLLGDAFYDASVEFSRRARAFDPAVPLDDLWQALRNVWIGNSLQMLLDRPVRLTAGLFAYSMLYPVTDNLLDAPDVTAAAKRSFNLALERRLSGERFGGATDAENRAFALVGLIEAEFPRHRYPDAWHSVRAIHRGQIESLRQHGGRASGDELLDISFAKGGASVLADLYLVAGRAKMPEERFAFGYGAFLQLLDDLQDVVTDMHAGHQTLFTLAAGSEGLDALTARLGGFIDVVLDSYHGLAADGEAGLDLIRRNCRALLVGAVAEHRELFSGPFVRRVEGQCPVTFRAMRRLRRHAHRQFQSAARVLQARYGVSSPLELLLNVLVANPS